MSSRRIHAGWYRTATCSPLILSAQQLDGQASFFAHFAEGGFFGQFARVDVAARGQPSLHFLVPQ